MVALDRSLLLNNVAGGNATAGEAQSAVSNNNFISVGVARYSAEHSFVRVRL